MKPLMESQIANLTMAYCLRYRADMCFGSVGSQITICTNAYASTRER